MADFIPSVKTGPDPSASSSDLLLSSVNSPDAYDMVRGKLHKSANAFRSCFLNADFILEAASLIFSVPPVSALRNKQPRVFGMQHTQALRELRLQEPVYMMVMTAKCFFHGKSPCFFMCHYYRQKSGEICKRKRNKRTVDGRQENMRITKGTEVIRIKRTYLRKEKQR